MVRLLPIAVGFYVLATCLGVLLRLFFVAPFSFLDFGNAVHAHSHTLYFGWGALGLFALTLRAGRGARILLAAIAAISAATFVSFLEGGYSLPSIVISALSLLLWPAGALLVWRQHRGERSLAASFLRVSLAYLLLASLGAAMRAVFMATEASSLAKSLAVFAFLHDFSWFFVFALLGHLLQSAPRLGLRLDPRPLRGFLLAAAPLAWLGFPLGVHEGSEGFLGLVARGSTLLLLAPGLLAARALWMAGAGKSAPHRAFRWLAAWLALDLVLAALGAAGLAELAHRSRHFVVLYLHVRLLGFFSLGLMLCAFAALRPQAAGFGRGFRLHNVGLVVMLAGLGLAGLPATGLPLPSRLLGAALPTAALGGLVTASAGLTWLADLLRPRPAALTDADLVQR